MKYKSGDNILPEALLNEVRKYIQGEYLYISKADGSRKKWGESTGTRKELSQRNENIRLDFKKGISIEELSENYFLSVNTIKMIVYSKNK